MVKEQENFNLSLRKLTRENFCYLSQGQIPVCVSLCRYRYRDGGGTTFTKFICLSLKICQWGVFSGAQKPEESHLYLAGKLPACLLVPRPSLRCAAVHFWNNWIRKMQFDGTRGIHLDVELKSPQFQFSLARVEKVIGTACCYIYSPFTEYMLVCH